MLINLVVVLVTAFFIASAIAGIIKLHMYGVSSKFFYVMAPLFPLITWILNIMIVFGDERLKTNKMSPLKKFAFISHTTFRKLPVFIDMLCNAAKKAEESVMQTKEKYDYLVVSDKSIVFAV